MQEIFHNLFHHHDWRHMKMSELSEIYISLTLRALGLSLIGIFIPVYFYVQGIPIGHIALYFAAYYLFRIFFDPITGMLISKYGPKHLMRFSYIVEIFYLLSIIAAGNGYIPIWMVIFPTMVTASFFFVPYLVDFSSVRSAKKVGGQVSFSKIIEKVAGALGPLAGGLIAAAYGFEVTIVAAMFITLLAGLPLLLTGEAKPQSEHRYKFRWSNYAGIKQDLSFYTGWGVTMMVPGTLWPIFVALFIFGERVYEGLGFITALSLLSTIIAAHAIGKLVDSNKGRTLMRFATPALIISHVLKPFISTVPGAITMGMVTDPLYTANDIPQLKGMYSRIERAKEGRVARIINILATLHFMRALVWFGLFALVQIFSLQDSLSILIFACGAMTLLLFTENFKALD